MTFGIGNTPLRKAEKLGKKLGIHNLYFKDEGKNPTGTQKDRLALHHADDALIQGKDDITVGSCGNYGVSTSYVASQVDIQAHICVPEGYTGARIKTMKRFEADLIEVPGTYEAAVNESKRLAGKKGWYDANPGGKNTTLGMLAYIDIPNEIMTLLRTNPTTMSIAVGNGTTLGGIHLGFRLLWRKKIAGKMPRMIAGSSSGNNPINESFKLGNKRIIELDHLSINETEINEPLINWHAYDGQEALNAIYDTGGAAYGFDDKALVKYGDLIRELEGIDVLPASAAALCALIKYTEEHEDNKEINDQNAFHVVVLTGRQNL